MDTTLVDENILSLEPTGLRGGRCASCDQVHFPVAAMCPQCTGDNVESIVLSHKGTVYAYTIVRVPVPHYEGPIPYGLGLVDLADGIRVTSMLRADPIEELRVGADVEFGLVELGAGETRYLSYSYDLVPS